jgi:hypothetical protein
MTTILSVHTSASRWYFGISEQNDFDSRKEKQRA